MVIIHGRLAYQHSKSEDLAVQSLARWAGFCHDWMDSAPTVWLLQSGKQTYWPSTHVWLKRSVPDVRATTATALLLLLLL